MNRYIKKILLLSFLLIISACVGESGGGKSRKSTSSTPSAISTGASSESNIRPSNAVEIKSDSSCVCKNNKPDSVGDQCVSVCSNKNRSDATFFAEVNLDSSIKSNTQLRDLKGWCEAELFGSDQKNPKCSLKLYSSEYGQENITVTVSSQGFEANVENLRYNVMYMAKLVESGSGSNVESKPFQIYRHDPESTTSGTVLTTTPVNMYSCLAIFTAGTAKHSWGKFHYIYRDDNQPSEIPSNVTTYLCHDNRLGAVDKITYPRLETVEKHLTLWNDRDSKFADLDKDGISDVNQDIYDDYYDLSNRRLTGESFKLIKWPNMPNITSSQTTPNSGMYMVPYNGICPKQSDYMNGDSYFRAIKKYIGSDTQGIYMAESDLQINSGTNVGTRDIMLISETDLKKIWYYLDGSTAKSPTDSNVSSKTIRFNWPPNHDSPFTLSSNTQLRYTIKFPSEIGSSYSGLATGVVPSDKKFGCIPKLN